RLVAPADYFDKSLNSLKRFLRKEYLMFIVVKHVKPSVRPMLRLALGVGLLSLLFVGCAQLCGLDLTSLAAARHVAYFGQRADEHQLKLASTSAAPGSEVIVPVEVNAEGSETRLSFSLYFDPAALLQPRVRLAEDTLGATLNLNTEQLAKGRLGIEVS